MDDNIQVEGALGSIHRSIRSFIKARNCFNAAPVYQPVACYLVHRHMINNQSRSKRKNMTKEHTLHLGVGCDSVTTFCSSSPSRSHS
jgi:hypothetical protein